MADGGPRPCASSRCDGAAAWRADVDRVGAWHILQAASVPCGGVKIKTSVAFSAPAQADGAWLTPPSALPITRLDPRVRADARFGGVSRAAKGADCKSAGLAFVGSSPTSPTSQELSHQRSVIRKPGPLMTDG